MVNLESNKRRPTLIARHFWPTEHAAVATENIQNVSLWESIHSVGAKALCKRFDVTGKKREGKKGEEGSVQPLQTAKAKQKKEKGGEAWRGREIPNAGELSAEKFPPPKCLEGTASSIHGRRSSGSTFAMIRHFSYNTIKEQQCFSMSADEDGL